MWEGFWKDDLLNGIGIEQWPSGIFYKGQFINGKKSGKGFLTF